jgi:hypothetical protein
VAFRSGSVLAIQDAEDSRVLLQEWRVGPDLHEANVSPRQTRPLPEAEDRLLAVESPEVLLCPLEFQISALDLGTLQTRCTLRLLHPSTQIHPVSGTDLVVLESGRDRLLIAWRDLLTG